jgi:hypothetical protein
MRAMMMADEGWVLDSGRLPGERGVWLGLQGVELGHRRDGRGQAGEVGGSAEE